MTMSTTSVLFKKKATMADVDKVKGYDPRKQASAPAPKNWSEWRLSDFVVGKPLGEGKFGHVYMARTKKEKMIVALKVIHSKQIEEDKMEHQINRETDIHIDLE